MAQNTAKYYSDPDLVMDPRNLGALQPNRLSASRSFMAKMVGEGWRIERDVFDLDAQGNGRARYTVTTPEGPVTFLAFLKQPSGTNRTGRIIGTAWDMSGALIDGIATPDAVAATERELPRLYEGRATENTLVWFRSNQSLRIFRSVRQALARGEQPDAKELKRVGYIMRNTGLDGNGTFGTMPFAAIPQGHPLGTSYHAQMLSAYLMRELSVDLVEELARIDAPETAVRMEPSLKRLIGVGNGSALGLAMLVYNRPVLVNAYISAYLKVLEHVLTDPTVATDDALLRLEQLLDRTIRYRTFLTTSYRFFTSNMEIVGDLRRIRAAVRAARRGDVAPCAGESVFGAIHRSTAPLVSKEALHSFETLLLELVPEFCDEVAASDLTFEEELDLDPRLALDDLRQIIDRHYGWALTLPLNDPPFRDRVWYQSRAAEEPRSGPREEVPNAHELIPSYPVMIRALRDAITEAEAEVEVDAAPSTRTIGALVAAHPELEHIARLVVALQDKPYAVPHADPHDTDFIPVWVIRFVNAFIHGLDRTEDHMGRDVRGIIFESAPYREAIAGADASAWWWSYEAHMGTRRAQRPTPEAVASPTLAAGSASPKLTPTDTPITPPSEHATETIGMKFREVRLMAGRAFQALNVPEGSWHGAREFVVTAMAADPGAPRAFGELLISAIDPDTALAGPWSAPVGRIEDGTFVIDNRGQSLLATGHVLVNLLGARASERPTRFRIVHVRPDHAVAGIALALERYGIRLVAEPGGDSVSGTVLIAAEQGLRDHYAAVTSDFRRNGRVVDAPTFWNIYYRGNAGLDADTPISRQHTGGTVLDVIRPGERITKQFSAEELHLLTDPDELDNQNFAELVTAH